MVPRYLFVGLILVLNFLSCYSSQSHLWQSARQKLNIQYDYSYPTEPIRQQLDVYYPKLESDHGVTSLKPVVLFIHGGAWQFGSKEHGRRIALSLVTQGFVVVSINYRLSSEQNQVKFPDHIRDVAKSFAWVYQNIGKFGGNANEIFVSGYSAGGHLAALLALDPSHLHEVGLTPKNITGVICISGVYEISPTQPELNTPFSTDEKACRKASPLEYVSAVAPPFLVLYAEHELWDLGDMAKKFANKLISFGIETKLVQVENRDHLTIFQNVLRSRKDPANQTILSFLQAHSQIHPVPKAAEIP